MAVLGYTCDFPAERTVEELRAELPDQQQFEVALSESERERYTPFREMGRVLQQRWTTRASRLNLG